MKKSTKSKKPAKKTTPLPAPVKQKKVEKKPVKKQKPKAKPKAKAPAPNPTGAKIADLLKHTLVNDTAPIVEAPRPASIPLSASTPKPPVVSSGATINAANFRPAASQPVKLVRPFTRFRAAGIA